ncbi:MAG: response regulator [Thermodesulfovibrionales bacterium]
MKTALIIEDNIDNTVLIQRLLLKAGYNAITAPTGREGIDMAISKRPDFILLDIQLPDIEGTEVLKIIRQYEQCRSIPIIAVTSYAMAGDRARLLSSGCDGYIEKPIDPLMVIEQIKSLVGGP